MTAAIPGKAVNVTSRSFHSQYELDSNSQKPQWQVSKSPHYPLIHGGHSISIFEDIRYSYYPVYIDCMRCV